MIRLAKALLLALATVACLGIGGFAAAAEDPPPLRIGVLAYRGKPQALAEWQPHADYLGTALAPRRFEIVPLTLEEFPPAIVARRIDFAVTNTGHYVELEAGGNVSRFATMRIAGPRGAVDSFGGAAFTRADRQDIATYRDLRGMRIATPALNAFGGWQVHLREALEQGIDLASATTQVETQAQDKAIALLLAGEVDAAFVRSDLVENLSQSGKLDAAKLRLINPRTTAGFPYLHSTRLYPHWPFARLDHVDEDLVRQMLIALLALPADHPAAKAAKLHSWTLGKNYQPVHEMFLELRLPPYDKIKVGIRDIAARYGVTLAAGASGLIVVLMLGLWIIARANGQLKRNEATLSLAAGVFDHAQEGIVITDAAGDIQRVNDTYLELTGYTRDELLGHNPRMLASGRHDAAFFADLWRTLLERGLWRGELWNRRKDGAVYAQQISISSIRDTHGRVTHFVGLAADVTASKESQARLEQLAYFDALTALPNRRLLGDRLKQAIAQTQRGGHMLAVCYLDLDGFKPVNDDWGHAAGDRLLIETAKRLNAMVRAGDTVSRLGGDEFVVLMGGLDDAQESEFAVERLREMLAQPYRLAEGDARLSASIGVTLYPLDDCDADTLIRHADQAMYIAKQKGRNRYAFYDIGGDRVFDARQTAADSIRAGLAENQFVLHYQPKVNMRSGEVVGAEALLRWQHPERGLLHPAEFLPVIEFVGMQADVGEWVLRGALRQLAAWADIGHRFTISVNIAAEQLRNPRFVDDLRALFLDFPDVQPHQIELELLETAALHDLREVAETIDACRALGVHFAIDDFGTGYSSLTYLKGLQARTLKIDRGFVRDMLEDPEDFAIVDGVIGLAIAFRRQVVAEGVETVAHGEMLLQLGCELAQGYGIARPMPADELPAWAAAWRRPDAWRNLTPLAREDLPLMTVEVDHLRWIRDFHKALESDHASAPPLPPLDPHQCRFGRWLDNNGRHRYGHLPSFAGVIAAHEAVHVTGQALAADWRKGTVDVRAGIDDLHARRDELLHALAGLRGAVADSP